MTCWNDWVARFISKGAILGLGQDRSRPKFDAVSIWIDGQSSRTTAYGCDFQPGHDSKLYAAIIKEVRGLFQLRGLVEKVIGRAIKVN